MFACVTIFYIINVKEVVYKGVGAWGGDFTGRQGWTGGCRAGCGRRAAQHFENDARVLKGGPYLMAAHLEERPIRLIFLCCCFIGKKKQPTQQPLTAKLCMCNCKKSLSSFGVLQIYTNTAVLTVWLRTCLSSCELIKIFVPDYIYW